MMYEGKYNHLIGKNFSYEGGQDCLTTAVDYFKSIHGIEVKNDYARYAGWERDGLNLFVDNFRNEGFEILDFPRADKWGDHLQDGDVLLMSIHGFSDRPATGVANHCAIWLEPRMILHHMFGRRSEIIPFKYKNSTTHILRHKDIPLKQKQVESVDFFDILSPRKREVLKNAQRATDEV